MMKSKKKFISRTAEFEEEIRHLKTRVAEFDEFRVRLNSLYGDVKKLIDSATFDPEMKKQIEFVIMKVESFDKRVQTLEMMAM